MTEYTSGEWEIEYDNDGNGCYSEWWNIVAPKPNSNGLWIKLGELYSKSDACLVSAAPELLEALKAAVKWYPNQYCLDIDNCSYCKWHKMAEQAIKKAEGE